jgi:hypothetical protein
VQPKEWGDLCGADHHVCRLADYPGGDLNAAPAGLLRTGVTTRLNRFIDHYAAPPGNPAELQPSFDVTASLEICPKNATAQFPSEDPGPTFTAARFDQLAPYTLRFDLTGTQPTKSPAVGNPHADKTDPFLNLLLNAGRCPVVTDPAGPDETTYETPPLASTATMIGGTKVRIDYQASTAAGLQLNSRLYDVFPDGKAVMVDRGPRRVTAPNGSVEYQLHGNGWRFEPGHRIRIEITQDDDPFLRASNIPSSSTINGVHLKIPVREPQPPVREDYKNAAKFCKAEAAFLGDAAFRQKYGANKNRANAFGECVSRSH